MRPNIQSIKWIDFQTSIDDRGALTAIEELRSIPIEIKRIFYIHDVIADRGGHAHVETDQIIISISGTFSVNLFDGKNKIKVDFSGKSQGLLVPRLIFTELFNFSGDAVCLVLANTQYDISKSLRDMDSYLAHVNYIDLAP